MSYLFLISTLFVMGGRADPVIMRAGELSLPITRCSTRESRPCTSPRQQSRAGPSGSADPKERKQENWPCLLLITARDELARAMLESSTGWRSVGLINQATTQTQNQDYDLAHPNIYPI